MALIIGFSWRLIEKMSEFLECFMKDPETTLVLLILLGEVLAFWIPLIYLILKRLITGEDSNINPFYPELG